MEPLQMDIGLVVSYCQSKLNDEMTAALPQFFKECDIDISLVKQHGEYDYLGMLFCEWFIFDYPLRRNMTPLKHYCEKFFGKADSENLRKLRQAERTNYCATFWITGVEPGENIVHLQEVVTGDECVLVDKNMANTPGFTTGIMSARLGTIDGTNYMMGNTVMFQPCEITDQAREVFAKGMAGKSEFTDFVKMRFGRQAYVRPANPDALDE